jgi:2-amino-4-hydroxy-6-hydroxymethyldihydropteridine diphosphokinase
VKSHSYFLLLGSNLNEPYNQLSQARFILSEKTGEITGASEVYQTAAWGRTKQNDFLNQVICIKSALDPNMMLQRVQQIEIDMGRARDIKWGPRTIDIDLLYIDQLIIRTSQLIIPHPEIQNRKFTLIPLCEIAPEFVHPKLKKTNLQLLAQCADTLSVERYILNTST